MKSTTFQQKILFSAKIFACMLILGILSWLSFVPATNPHTAGAASDVTLSVVVSGPVAPDISATAPPKVSQSVPVSGTSNDVNSIEVWLDKNGDGIINGDDVKLDSDIVINADGTFNGTVILPDGLGYDEYQLIVLGHTNNVDTPTVQDTVVVDYVPDGPDINCLYNYDNGDGSCSPGQDNQGFGSVDGGTEIVIEGDNFGDEGDTVVTIGDQECVITSISGNKITCIVPKSPNGQGGPQDVMVCVNTDAGPLCTTMEDGFVYLPETPETGPGLPGTGLFRIGNTVVTIRDVVLWTGLIVILAVAIMLIVIVKSPSKTTRYSLASGSNRKRSKK